MEKQNAKPGLFASLTRDENDILADHLRSGWTKQHKATNDGAGFWETADILDELRNDWWARKNAGLD